MAVEHYKAIERMTGKPHPRLADAPRLPEGCEALWTWFNELHGSRGSNGFGPSRISFVDIDAWQRVTGLRLAPWELDAIRRADNAYLADHASRQKKTN